VDTILTRMGAYDNMFSNASTFKVELDEWCVSAHIFRVITQTLISFGQLQDPPGRDSKVVRYSGR
jgi:DNA mismatch repair protein MSH6